MKLRELITEQEKVSLIGMFLNHQKITADTKNEIWYADFWCSNLNLTTLEGAPKIVNGNFWCAHNYITSLEGAPERIGGDFDCTDNPITNLKDIHKIIKKMDGYFYCLSNVIKSHVLGLLLIDGLKLVYGNKHDEWANILNKYVGKGRKGMLDCQNELIEAGLEEYAQL